jgi:prephenate dehydratase
LGEFAERGINLSKLESRPIIGKAWHYMFYIDIEAGIGDTRSQEALTSLRDTGNEIIELGSYPSGHMPD